MWCEHSLPLSDIIMMALQLEVKMFELGTVAVNDVDGDFSWSGVHVEHM